jgi:hypothetical protein
MKLCENLPEPLKPRQNARFCQDLQAGWGRFLATPLFSLCENAIAKEPG